MSQNHLRRSDPDIYQAVCAEANRQRTQLEMIASENFVSRAVMEATGSALTNKYAEGLPGKRYYGGCEHVDVVEDLARSRACTLFQAEHANVQPHSGAQANMAAFLAFLRPGDRFLGMRLSHGGHLTHGSKVNVSGKWFQVSSYGVRETDGLIDYDLLRDQALSERPRMIVAGASAYPRILDFAAFGEIAREADALLMVDMAHIAGLVATGLHPSPIPHAHVVTTTTHKTLRGPRGGLLLAPAEHARAVDRAVFPGSQGGPMMHVIAAKAVAFREALEPEFAAYTRRVVANARALGAELMEHGFRLVSGGTDTHLVLVDFGHDGISGARAEGALARVDITVNKNTVPGERRSPLMASGIRLGTPALTSRGMGINEMRLIGGWMARVLRQPDDDEVLAGVREEVRELCASFPVRAEAALVG